MNYEKINKNNKIIKYINKGQARAHVRSYSCIYYRPDVKLVKYTGNILELRKINLELREMNSSCEVLDSQSRRTFANNAQHFLQSASKVFNFESLIILIISFTNLKIIFLAFESFAYHRGWLAK